MEFDEKKLEELLRNFYCLEEKLQRVLTYAKERKDGKLQTIGKVYGIETDEHLIVTDRKIIEQFRHYKKLKHLIDKMIENVPAPLSELQRQEKHYYSQRKQGSKKNYKNN